MASGMKGAVERRMDTIESPVKGGKGGMTGKADLLL